MLAPPALAAPTVGDLEASILARRAEKDSVLRHADDSPLRPQDIPGFQGLRYYPVDPDWRIEGQLHRYGSMRQVPLADTEGTTITVERLGRFVFDHDGKSFWLEVYRSLQGGEMNVYFTDQTNGEQTYGAGRYASVTVAEDGTYILDFNGAYNPYCAYNPVYVCPLPPPYNHLPFRVEAGELTAGPDLAHP